nr:hypothetical protein [Acetobacter persici]
MSYLEIKHKKSGAELNLRSHEDFMGLKTFYISKKQNKETEDVLNVLSSFGNNEISFLSKHKLSPTAIDKFPRYAVRFDKIQNIGILSLVIGDTVFYFNLRKSSDHMLCEYPKVYAFNFSKMSHEPFI